MMSESIFDYCLHNIFPFVFVYWFCSLFITIIAFDTQTIIIFMSYFRNSNINIQKSRGKLWNATNLQTITKYFSIDSGAWK